ncbi:MAG: DUF3318 domain-containing protein [Burkholderiales bacterium]|nr:DUF3318 domain-containing protein [Burkholderiales bacterium]MDE2287118.1 DUF3318 domain-containing protein [Burkholderiales bacterium]MDE2610098.1 DUF3318 domain-containing protein [Burkholderiales bacterium]
MAPDSPDPSRLPRRPVRRSRYARRDLLALRKELVLTRITVERAELGEAVDQWRHAARGFGWVRLLARGRGQTAAQSLLSLSGLLQRYPYLSSVASLVLTGLTRTRLGKIARPLAKWGAFGMLAWKGYTLWQAASARDGMSTATRAAPASDDDFSPP